MVILYNLFANGEPDSRAREFVPLVQPLKHAEYAFKELRTDSQPAVLHGECPLGGSAPLRGDVDVRDSGALLLDGVADQVLE